MHKSIGILFCCALLWGCETVIDVDPPDYTPELVVNSFFSPDSVWSIHVSRSAPILDAELNQEQSWVENAVVEVLEAEQRVATLTYRGRGVYRAADEKPVGGKTYTVKVQAPGFTPVEATDTLPVASEFSNVRTSDGGFTEEGTPLTRLQVDLVDPAHQTDHYFLSVLASDPSSGWTTSSFFISDDPVLRRGEDLLDDESSFYIGRFFSDAQFQGETYTLTLDVPEAGIFGGDTHIVQLSHVSPAFFRYDQTRRLQDDTKDNPFAEPVPIFTNVEGGLGIFAGITPEEVIRFTKP